MNIDNLTIIPKTIKKPSEIEEGFKEIFNSDEAKKAKGVVYFFLSKNPVPRVCGSSKIIYIGKTDGSLKGRWGSKCSKLASDNNRHFYEYIINSYGGLQVGYIFSKNPRATEREMFKKYKKQHLEFPPKSKVG